MGAHPVAVVLREVVEVLEKLPHVYIPAAVEPCLPDLRGQPLQLLDVFRLPAHEHLVVCRPGRDEGVIRRILVLLELPLDKQALHPLVPDPAGVAGDVYPLWVPIYAADAGNEHFERVLRVLRGLVDVQHVALRTLKSVQVLFGGQIPEQDLAPVGKCQLLFGVVVAVAPLGQHLPHGLDVVGLQLRVGLADDDLPDARPRIGQQYGFYPHGPALAAPSGAAVGYILVRVRQKQFLPLVGWVDLYPHLA